MEFRNVLTLVPQDPEFLATAFALESRRAQTIEGKRLDIVIDGRPLRYWWRGWEQPEWERRVPVPDLVTRLSGSSPREAFQQVDQLTGPRPGGAGRPLNFSIAGLALTSRTGILAVELSRTKNTVTWQRIGWIDEADDTTADALIPNAPDFTFDAAAYDRALDEVRVALFSGFRARWKKRMSSIWRNL